jgi:hypothetical protein
MADEFEIDFGVLNITAQPHSDPAVYRNLLKKIAGKYTNFYDQDWAAITEPERYEAGLHAGRVMIWTELDPDSPAIDKKHLEEVSLQDANIELPPEYGINGRTFFYLLREKDHRIFFEWKNDLNHHLAPSRFKNILDRLFAKTNDDGAMHVSISIQHEDDALDKILALPVLKTFEVHLTPPNPDDNDDEAEEVLAALESQNAKAKHVKLEKKSGKTTLKPDEETMAEARVAAAGNGYVKAKGLDKQKKRAEMSTADYPLKITRRALDRTGVFALIIWAAKNVTIGRRK